MNGTRVCSFQDCQQPADDRGWCPDHTASRAPLSVRLARRLVENPETGCLEWSGQRNRKGYGIIREGGRGTRTITTHRAAWIAAHGSIPDDLFVCHHCDNRPCCNLDHLFLGTCSDNIRDRVAKSRFVGEDSPVAKRTRAQIVEVRRMYADGCTYAEMSAFLGGISSSYLSDLIHGRSWKSAPGVPTEKRSRRKQQREAS